MKDQLEGLVSQMVERGILFDEAVGRIRKTIHQARSGPRRRQSIARRARLGIHRNTLSRKLTEYKLDHRRHASR